MRFLITAGVLLSALALSAQAAGEDLGVDAVRKEALGKWERFAEFDGQTYRLVKDIREKEETLTAYTLLGEATYQHKVKYEITAENNLGVFTYWDFTVTISEPTENTPAKDVRTRYVFRIKDGKWYQTSMFGETPGIPQLHVWQRPQMPPEVIKELSYFVGDWKTEGTTGNVKSRGHWNTKWSPDYYCLSIDTAYRSVGAEKGGHSTGLFGWDAKKQEFGMHNFWSFNENYTSRWRVLSDSEWEGELVGVEDGKDLTTKVKVLKKSPDEFVYFSKNAAGEEIEVVFRK